jgi:hypothetical protein
MKTYEIQWSNGRRDGGYETEDAARDVVLADYHDAEIGHDGDLSDGGERTLCWADEEASVGDDGARSICAIVAVAS